MFIDYNFYGFNYIYLWMDGSGIYKDRGPEFFAGVEDFLRAAAVYKKPTRKRADHYICCPCVDCKNEKQFSNIEQIRTHLICMGFKAGYTYWTEHSELEDVMHEGQ